MNSFYSLGVDTHLLMYICMKVILRNQVRAGCHATGVEILLTPCTLGRINSFPELFNSINKLIFRSWLNFTSNNIFQLVPHIFHWVQVRRFWSCLPPIYALLFKKRCCQPRSMLRVIVLHEPVTLRILLGYEWQQGSTQYFNIQYGIHCPIKDTNLRGATNTDASPDMNFLWMLWPKKE